VAGDEELDDAGTLFAPSGYNPPRSKPLRGRSYYH
jgi:hypothetical protein